MKPHTNFRTVPVTERLPEKDGDYYAKYKGQKGECILKIPFLVNAPSYWIDSVDFWLEEIPGQAEHESPFCPYCGNFKRMPGNDLIVPLCICTDWSKQAEVKSAEEILKKHIPNGIVNIKAVGKGNGKPQYQAEIAVIIKCMHEFRNQPTPKPTDEEIEIMAQNYAYNRVETMSLTTNELIIETYQTAAKDCRDGKIVKPKE